METFLQALSRKTSQRLRELRKKYRELMHTSHNGGAGGSKTADLYQDYKKIKEEIDHILAKRNKENKND
jgi:hypothetical protein